MTALKPSEDRNVCGVASVRYPLNSVCAHPECGEPAGSAHHCYPRSQIGNASWFVAFGRSPSKRDTLVTKDAIPHVVGLCGDGTTGHHGDLEDHRAWIKLEDGVFVWYDRDGEGWVRVGPLNPQPGSREGSPKRRRRSSTPEERRARRVYSIRTPEGEENILPELVGFAQDAFQRALQSTARPLPYVTVVAALKEFVERYGG